MIDTPACLVYPAHPMNYENMDDTAWDALCKRCGQCCFEKIENERGTIFYTQTPCRYLDVATRECKVYDRRAAINPACIKLTPELLGTLRWLHPDCGYRQAFPELSPGGTKPGNSPRKNGKRRS